MDDTMKSYIHSKVSDDFGLSVDDVAKHVGSSGRFSGWLGGDQSKIKEVLNAVKDAGVSPAFFASYEVGEGYNASWGWLNHTVPQGSPVEDARAVANWIISQSHQTAQPAWIDYANYKDFVPDNVKQEGNADAKNLPDMSIGRVVISGTAAATWEVYYPKGLEPAYNGVQQYGKPLTDQMERILSWGGKIDGKGGTDSGSSGSDDSGSSGSSGSSALDLLKQAFTGMIKQMEEWLEWDMHSVGGDKFFSNNYFALTKTFNNTYRLQYNNDFLSQMKQKIESIAGSSSGSSGSSGSDDSGSSGGNDGDYNTCDLKHHNLNFRYAKTQADFPPGYPFPSANGHHGNDYNYLTEKLISPVSGTVNGNNNHGYTVNDGGIGYDGDGMGWGNRIVIKLDDGSGRSVLFAHLSQIDVKSGDKIKVGQQIGITGNTGEQTSGAHLHFELKDAKDPNAASDGTIDPTPFVDKHCKS